MKGTVGVDGPIIYSDPILACKQLFFVVEQSLNRNGPVYRLRILPQSHGCDRERLDVVGMIVVVRMAGEPS